jgi:GNAT superfamily N-acetyltransferase
MRVREATVEDAPLVARQRALMFQELRQLSDHSRGTFQSAMLPDIERVLGDGTYRGWFMALPDGGIVGGAGVLLRPLLPRPDVKGPEAIVLNVFVEPAWRRRGVARGLMEAVLRWCAGQNIRRVVLHASDEGRPLYESLGFVPTGEMIYRDG